MEENAVELQNVDVMERPWVIPAAVGCHTPVYRAPSPRACDPYHDGAVLRGAGDDMVIVRTPVHIQNWTCVTTHCRVGLINTTRLQREGGWGWGREKDYY